ncbi:MAG: type II toxin-antitoxin system HicA family toxin [Spirochaetota bacterium]|nr:type II toxin-antitoxin system HicA family toxin [Spirochaetota bacterium]
MAKLKPISLKKLISGLRMFGFEGPKGGGKHLYMKRETLKLSIPNPHKQKDISVGLLSEILSQAGISREEWIDTTES